MNKPQRTEELRKYLTTEHAEFAERRRNKKLCVLCVLCGQIST